MGLWKYPPLTTPYECVCYKRDNVSNRFQPETSTFLRTFSFNGITKQARKYHIPVSIFFKKQISQYTIYLLNSVLGYFYSFTMHSSIAKGTPISVFRFLVFFPKYQFFIFTSQNSSRFGGKSLYRPLSDRGFHKIYF